MMTMKRKRNIKELQDSSNLRLPRALSNVVNTDDDVSKHPKKRKKDKKGTNLSRKQRRKEDRKLKKMRKCAFNLHQKVPTRESLQQEKEEKKREERKIKQEESKMKTKEKRKRKRREKRQQSQSLRVQGLKEANKLEDKLINQLEKQMGMKRRKNLPKGFADDGLDFLLDVVNPEYMEGLQDKEDEEGDLDMLLRKGDTSDEEDDDVEDDLEDGMDEDEEEMEEQEEEEDAEVEEGVDDDDDGGDDEEDVDDDNMTSDEGQSDNDDSMDDSSQDGESIDSDSQNDVNLKSSAHKQSTIKPQVASGTGKLKHKRDLNGEENVEKIKKDQFNSDKSKKKVRFSEEMDSDVSMDDDDGDISDDNSDDGDESDSDDVNESEEETTRYKEDIYGRLIDPEGNQVKTATKAAYVPPAKRLAMAGKDEKQKINQERLQKQLKGLINRLSESNMQSICSQAEGLYQQHSRADMNDALVTVLFAASLSTVTIPERLLQEHAMLVAILHRNIGMEVGAAILQKLACRFEQLYQDLHVDDESKEIHNLLTLLANIYNFRVIHSPFIFDVFKKLTDRFDERDIELILVLLRSVGFTLRKADPSGLKAFIMEVQAKANSVDTKQFKDQSRVKFMLEILTAIKNNNIRKIPSYDHDHIEHLRKLIHNFVSSSSSGDTQLQISLQDLLNADEHGKWWLVGSAWTNQDKAPFNKAVPTSIDGGASQQLLELARKQRMNTDVRKNIFCIIMSSEDFVDAFEKLLHLGLKHQQERSIIQVIVDVCLQEKHFNPYYAYLTQKFCEYSRQFQRTLQFVTWDYLKRFNELGERQRTNLADLLTHLIITKAASLLVFKDLEFCELDKLKVQFLKRVLSKILLEQPDSLIQETFKRITKNPKLQMLREGLRLFMQHFMLRTKSKDPVTANKLTAQIELAEKALSSGDTVMGL